MNWYAGFLALCAFAGVALVGNAFAYVILYGEDDEPTRRRGRRVLWLFVLTAVLVATAAVLAP